jgi:hypothetical protein
MVKWKNRIGFFSRLCETLAGRTGRKHKFIREAAMEEACNPGGSGFTGGGHAGGYGGGHSVGGGGASGGGVSSVGGESAVDDLDELWVSRPSSAAAMLAQIWGHNPTTSEGFPRPLAILP